MIKANLRLVLFGLNGVCASNVPLLLIEKEVTTCDCTLDRMEWLMELFRYYKFLLRDTIPSDLKKIRTSRNYEKRQLAQLLKILKKKSLKDEDKTKMALMSYFTYCIICYRTLGDETKALLNISSKVLDVADDR